MEDEESGEKLCIFSGEEGCKLTIKNVIPPIVNRV
jgi:hypothetical protein